MATNRIRTGAPEALGTTHLRNSASLAASPSVAQPSGSATVPEEALAPNDVNSEEDKNLTVSDGQDSAIVQSVAGLSDAQTQQLQAIGGAKLLANLDKLATEPLAPGIDRKKILAEAVAGVLDPSTIREGTANTCGAATTETMLAQQNPAEYVRIVAGLASRQGSVTLANGQTLTRDSGWYKAKIPGAANQLVQTAFMAYAAGGYNAATDTRADGQKGLYDDEEAYLQQSVLGKADVEVDGNSNATMAKIAAQANSGKPVSVLVDFNGEGHYVEVKGVKNGQVSYVDPRDGQVHSASTAEFQKIVKAANLDAPGKKLSTVRPTQHRGILGGCGNPFKAIAHAVTSVVHAISNALGAIGNAIGGPFSGLAKLGQAAFDIVTNALNDVAKDMRKLADKAIKAVKKVGHAIVKAVKKVGHAIVKAVKKVGHAISKAWKKVAPYVMTIATIVCAVVPGLQVVAVALAAYQAVKAGKMLVQGIKTGNWKEAVVGIVGVVASVAGGIGALGAKVVGTGLEAAADTAGKVASVAEKVYGAAEAIKSGNPGAIVGAVASAVSAGAGFVSSSAGALATKLGNYASSLTNAGEAIAHGDVAAGLADGAGLAGDALQAEGDQTAAADLSEASNLVSKGVAVGNAIKSGNAEALVSAGSSLAADGAQDLGDSGAVTAINSATSVLDEGAKVLDEGKAVYQAVASGNVAGIANSAAQLADTGAQQLGFSSSGIDEAAKLVDQGVAVDQAIASGNVAGIANSAAQLADTGAGQLGFSSSGIDQAAKLVDQGAAVAQAAQRGDVLGAANAAAQLADTGAARLGFSSNGIDQAAKVVDQGAAVAQAAQRGDVLGAANAAASFAANGAADLGYQQAASKIGQVQNDVNNIASLQGQALKTARNLAQSQRNVLRGSLAKVGKNSKSAFKSVHDVDAAAEALDQTLRAGANAVGGDLAKAPAAGVTAFAPLTTTAQEDVKKLATDLT